MNPLAPFALVIIQAPQDIGRVIHLYPGTYVIGRTEAADIRIVDATVSRRHARLTVTENDVTVEDAESTCGIEVNHERILGAVSLQPGAILRIGQILFQLTAQPRAP